MFPRFQELSQFLMMSYDSDSVTRLGNFCLFGTIFISPWTFLEGLCGRWQNDEPTLAFFNAIGLIFIIVNDQMSRK